jgi:hypothetical protein
MNIGRGGLEYQIEDEEYWEMKVRLCIPHRKGRAEDGSEEEGGKRKKEGGR